MSVVKKIKKAAAKAADKLVPLTNKELHFLESVLEKRFLNFGVEPTNICNANCSYCAYRFSKVPKRIMPIELFKKAVDQYNSLGGGPLGLTPTVGDPLVDKGIIEKIKLARTYPNITNIFFYTNALGLNNFDLEKLLRSGINRISVSTTIGSREMYHRICGVDKYDIMLNNLLQLLETNKKLKYPVNIILAVRNDRNFDLSKNDDYKRIERLLSKKDITHMPDIRGYDNWGGAIDKKDLPAESDFRKSESKRNEPCAELYRRINVLANGEVNFCVCRDYNYELVIGNVQGEGLLNIWRGTRIKKIREDWRQGRIPKVCATCSFYVPLSRFLKKSRVAIWSLARRVTRGR